MERKCKNYKYCFDVDDGYFACELDGETVNKENSCDFFDEDRSVTYKKNKKKEKLI